MSHLRVRRRGSTLRASWTRVKDASAYELVVMTNGAGQRRLRVRGTSVTVRGIAKSTGGRVNVRAIALLREGPTAGAAFHATARLSNRLRTLPRPPRLH